MGRLVLVLLVALAGGVALTTGAEDVRAQPTPSIVVSPESGTMDSTFVFTGSDFFASDELSVRYISPVGDEYSFVVDGVDLVVVVGEDGTLEVSVTPSNDFTGVDLGTWQVEFCQLRNGVCRGTTIEILP